MSESVEVPFDKPSDQAVLLLAAAEELGLDPSVVKTSEGAFQVPQEVHDKAFGKGEAKDEGSEEPEEKKATKKTAAQKRAEARKQAEADKPAEGDENKES